VSPRAWADDIRFANDGILARVVRATDSSPPAAHRAAIPALYGAGVVQGFAMVSFAACGAVLKDRLGLSDAQYGTIFLPQVALAVVGALAGASLAQRVGLRRLLVLGFVASALSQAALAGAEWAGGSAFAFVTAGTALMGLGAGLNGAPLNAAPQLLFPARSDAAVVGMHAAMGLGLAVGPLVVTAAQAAGNWTLFPISLLLACFAVAATATGIRLPEPVPAPSGAGGAGPHPIGSAAFWTFAAIAVLYAFAEACFANWAILYLHEDKRLPLATAAGALSTFWVTLSAGRVLATLATLRLPAEALWLSLPVIMITAFLLLPRADTAPLAFGLFALAGLGCSAFFPLTVGLASRRFPFQVAWVSAALFAALAAGIGAASFLLGVLRAFLPLARMYRLGAAVPAVVLALALVATRRSLARSQR
jgi:fucose permease